MKDEHPDGYCGLYCGACNYYIATREGELGELSAHSGQPVESLGCHGCKSDQVREFCETCDFRDCARFHQVESCAECPDGPCERLLAFTRRPLSHLRAIPDNHRMIRELGREAWLEAQHKRWSCAECGTPHAWYQDTCSNCHRPVHDAREDIVVPEEEE
jgi:hypothetical protein